MESDVSGIECQISWYHVFLSTLLSRSILLIMVPSILASCAPVVGYSDDPANETAVLASLTPYFNPSEEKAYSALTDPVARKSLRDDIVINRIRAYNIKFGQFEKRLWGDGNTISAGGDIVGLILGGLGATTGSAATKSALAAASAGVIGAQGAINKDLYYQRTLPALLAQIEANRDTIEAPILKGLQEDDRTYSLYRADLDLDSLQRASGIPEAISQITGQASDNKAVAQANLQTLTFATSAPATKIRAWLYQSGKVNTVRYAQLQIWLNEQPEAFLHNYPPAAIATGDDPNHDLEPIRQRALSDGTLGIPN